MNATAEMQWRSPQVSSRSWPSLDLLFSYRISLFAGKLAGFVRRRSSRPQRRERREVTAVVNVEIRLSPPLASASPRGIVVRSSHFLPPRLIGSSISLSCLERGMWFTINRTPV
jgi:hypothetical protein